jgi:hypothetical protein
MAAVPGFFRRAFTQHLELKFLALIIGLVIFYSRERQESAERTLQVDLMAIGQESLGGLIRVSPLPAKVEVAVRGPEKTIAALRSEHIGPVAISMADAVATGRIELRRDMFNLPDGVRLLWASPAAIDFRFEKRSEKTVPVVPQFGPPDADMALDGAVGSVQPAEVTLTGPESAVAPITEVRTETVVLAGLRAGTYLQTVRLLLPEDGRVTSSAERARVQVALEADVVESERTGVPVEVVRGTDFDPRGTLVYGAAGLRVNVRVRGLRRVVEQLDNSELRLFVRAEPAAFTERDGDGVQEADLPVEAERRSEAWSVVAIEPPTVSMTWIPPPAPPPPDPAAVLPPDGEGDAVEPVAGEGR